MTGQKLGFAPLIMLLSSCILSSCYYVEAVTFRHENYGEENPFDTRVNYDIAPIYEGNNAFLVNMRGAYSYDSSLPYMRDKSWALNVNVSIYSSQQIGDIVIDSCEVLFGDESIVFGNDDLRNSFNGMAEDPQSAVAATRYYARVEKVIDTAILNAYIKTTLDAKTKQPYVVVNTGIRYTENGTAKNREDTTRFYINVSGSSYSPGNLWGGLP